MVLDELATSASSCPKRLSSTIVSSLFKVVDLLCTAMIDGGAVSNTKVLIEAADFTIIRRLSKVYARAMQRSTINLPP
jgi:hypothetical protein